MARFRAVSTGQLYRNGPGLFERGTLRKPHLLDGDGLRCWLSFVNGKVRYQNAFVCTDKVRPEEKADAFRFPTWSMRRPGGMLANLGGGPVRSQAGVTVYPFNDILYAFDEISPAYGLDPATLATLGEEELGDPQGRINSPSRRTPSSIRSPASGFYSASATVRR